MGDEFTPAEISKMAWADALKKVNTTPAPVSHAIDLGAVPNATNYPPPP
jgi:hypothetical protein